MRRLVVALLAALALVPFGAAPAYAHGGGPKTATPASDAQVAELPLRVELDFGEPLREIPVAISVMSPEGQQMARGLASVEGTVAGIDLNSADAAPAGKYTVAYQVVFEDGAALKSKYEFTLTVARAAAENSTTGNASGSDGPAQTAADSSGDTQWPALAGILGGMLLLVGLALYLTLALSKKGHLEDGKEPREQLEGGTKRHRPSN